LLLSICIPTHHGRAHALRRALDSVVNQLTEDVADEVEVCVTDNASQDGTEQVVAETQKRADHVVYHRNARDLGLVPNLFKSIEMASGTFCWLLGSDDEIVEGGIAQTLDLLRRHGDVAGVTLNRVQVDHLDRTRTSVDPADELPDDPDRMHVYDSPAAIFANVGLSQDYMSTQILNRRVWQEALRETSEEELAYTGDLAHLLVLGKMVNRHPRWIWFPDRLVCNTTGNAALDQELGYRYARYQLTIMEGRARVWRTLFGDRSDIYKRVMRKAYLRTTRPLSLVAIKLAPTHTLQDDVALVTGLPRYFYWLPRFWAVTFPLLLVPHHVLKLMSRVKRRLA
jgi:abequosyltransferase